MPHSLQPQVSPGRLGKDANLISARNRWVRRGRGRAGGNGERQKLGGREGGREGGRMECIGCNVVAASLADCLHIFLYRVFSPSSQNKSFRAKSLIGKVHLYCPHSPITHCLHVEVKVQPVLWIHHRSCRERLLQHAQGRGSSASGGQGHRYGTSTEIFSSLCRLSPPLEWPLQRHTDERRPEGLERGFR